ncbi:ABC transporter substrate-binding protein [Corynebacterium sp. 3HC-13]|uniref:ABC transporter substrate-binding protein n=1 Tax=Corynebacterium poyangense TaxID=2684405 RepID=UPI001CCA5563|nr:ABC transporter substrate-binding protein [Corynebacterium poyangense]MBZ8177686.1 ABC transporter substrate-binding protein [Corynebacterium poyangense]
MRLGEKTSALLGVFSIAGLVLTGCSAPESAKDDAPAQAAGADIEVESCGRTVHLDHIPERVVFQNNVGASQLMDLGLMDKVVARSGDIDTSVYAPDQASLIDALPRLEGTDLGSGHTKLATETLLDNDVDLVLSHHSGVDIDKAEESGIAVYIPAAYCSGAKTKAASFDDVKKEVSTFGTLFGVEDKAEALNQKITTRIEELEKEEPQSPLRGKKAIALFITPGDTGTVWAYGTGAMIQPQFEALGMKNLYDDRSERVFEVSMEDVLAKDPDLVVLLHTAGTEEDVMTTFQQIRGYEALRAYQNKAVVVMPYSLVDPPSSLSLQGVDTLKEKFSQATLQ